MCQGILRFRNSRHFNINTTVRYTLRLQFSQVKPSNAAGPSRLTLASVGASNPGLGPPNGPQDRQMMKFGGVGAWLGVPQRRNEKGYFFPADKTR